MNLRGISFWSKLGPRYGLLGFLVLAAWWWILPLPFTGVDIWPIFVQSQVVLQQPGALWSQIYLQDLWEGVRFWRPGWTAFCALEGVLFGDRPWMYHAVRLGLLVLSGGLAGYLASRSYPEKTSVSWWMAALLVVWHPIQAETVPVVSRAADSLAAVALLGTLAGLAGFRERGWNGASFLGLLLALIAPTFKETGLLGPLLAIVLLEPWKSGTHKKTAWTGTALLMIGLLGHIGRRWWMMGTLGRYDDTLPPLPPLEAAIQLFCGLIDHQGFGTAWLVLVLAGTSGVTWFFLRKGRDPFTPTPGGQRIRRACVFWTVLGALVFVTSPLFRIRYAEAILPPLTILVAGTLPRLFFRESRRKCLPGFLATAAVLVAVLPGTPLIWRYPQWRLAGNAAQVLLNHIDHTLQECRRTGHPVEKPLGRFTVLAEPMGAGFFRVHLDPLPIQPAQLEGFWHGRLANVGILSPYAVNSFLQLQGWPPGSVFFEPGLPLLGMAEDDLPQPPSARP